MSLIVNIETALEKSFVSLCRQGEILSIKTQPEPKQTAAWIQSALKDLLIENGYGFKDLHAVAVSAGPGSYTGLRVGMSTAKGLCYALDIPLITLKTLEIIAGGVDPDEGLICPMIDARRMEVYTAVYDKDLTEIVTPVNMILNDQSFSELLEKGKITFCGNGCAKFERVLQHKNAVFAVFDLNASVMASQAQKAFENAGFADLAYIEPIYGKAFFSPAFKPPE